MLPSHWSQVPKACIEQPFLLSSLLHFSALFTAVISPGNLGQKSRGTTDVQDFKGSLDGQRLHIFGVIKWSEWAR